MNRLDLHRPPLTPSPEKENLAAELRFLADQLMCGEVNEVIATVFRRDGSISRIGLLPTVTRIR